MSKHPAQRKAQLTVHVSHGIEDFWRIIRRIDADRPWSISEIHNETVAVKHRETVSKYVRRLIKAGYAKPVGERRTNYAQTEKTYKLLKRPVDSPVMTRNGTELPPQITVLMWNAIRALKQFDTKEVHYLTSQARKASFKTIKRYVRHLHEAGYLVIISEPRSGKPGIYRLKPSMNTGPLPPKILRFHVVWDDNRQAVVGEAHDASEVTS